LPVHAVRQIIARSPEGIAGLEPVMHIRPQSVASAIEITNAAESEAPQAAGALGEPILALLDGVPVVAHRLLADHLFVDDQFGLEPITPVADRAHGTAIGHDGVGSRHDRDNPIH
jgi:hypothetical protein